MIRWLASATGSWLAATAALALLSYSGLTGEQLPAHELPLALAGTAILHFAVCALLFEPTVRLSRRMGAASFAPLLLMGVGFVPLLFFVMFFGGTAVDVFTPEGVLFLGFFATGGLVFGLIRVRQIGPD